MQMTAVVAIAMVVIDVMVRAFGDNNIDLNFSLVVCCSDGGGGGNCSSRVEVGYRGNYGLSSNSSRSGIKWQ